MTESYKIAKVTPNAYHTHTVARWLFGCNINNTFHIFKQKQTICHISKYVDKEDSVF